MIFHCILEFCVFTQPGTYPDIASVNTALSIQHTDGRIERAHIAAGGVAAIPCYLTKTCAYLHGKLTNLNYS